jgi:hypothetical protein
MASQGNGHRMTSLQGVRVRVGTRVRTRVIIHHITCITRTYNIDHATIHPSEWDED